MTFDKVTVQGTLAIGVTVAFVSLVVLWMTFPPQGDQANLSLLNALIMVVGTAFLTVVNWYFGSSSGSKDKDVLIERMSQHLADAGEGPAGPSGPQGPRGPQGLKGDTAMVIIAALVTLALTMPSAEAAKSKRLILAPISEEDCQRIRDAVATYGIAIVEAGAAARGYTRAQITQARAYCK